MAQKPLSIPVGTRFGSFTVTGLPHFLPGKSGTYVLCTCDCGKTIEIKQTHLNTGKRNRCFSCFSAQYVNRVGPRKHGVTSRKHPSIYAREYRIWQAMRSRVSGRSSNPEHYCDRGITSCERWNSFEAFLADMGKCPPGMSLDRRDNDGGYTPDNCRWATALTQNNNSRHCVFLLVNGEKVALAELARRHGLKDRTVYTRYYKGERPPELLRPVNTS